jgi:hypothetical protein
MATKQPNSEEDFDSEFERKPMVDWFAPAQLFDSGMKVVLSNIFGVHADKREMQAALQQGSCFDYSSCQDDNGEFWLDYIADIGEGWNSTYSMAYLLAQEQLFFKDKDSGETKYLLIQEQLSELSDSGEKKKYLLTQEQLSELSDSGEKKEDFTKIKRGKILIMGGDEVYPTPTREEYRNRLIGPYQAALPSVKEAAVCPPVKEATACPPVKEAAHSSVKEKELPLPHLFTIPGNHDWYDGLTSFLRLFCQGHKIGGWQTRQNRSYFALKLPHNWWLWGIDIQFDSDLDKPQRDFFSEIAEKQMKKGDKVILCTAKPEWVFCALTKDSKCYDNLVRFEKEIICPNGVLVLTLSGDLHHYCRYETDKGTQQKITAGGGGAFLHATHNMPKKLLLDACGEENASEKPALDASAEENAVQKKVTYSRAKVFPEMKTSKRLALGAFLLPLKNWKFALFVGLFYQLYAWILLQGYAIMNGEKTLMAIIHGKLAVELVFTKFGLALLYGPAEVFTLLIVFGLWFFGKWKWKLDGLLHGIAHVLLNILLIWFLVYLNFSESALVLKNQEMLRVLLFFVEMIVVGGFLGSLLVGVYLVICSFLKINLNEAFACQSIPDYKNFLRLHIDKAGQLTVYPIGVKTVCKKWKWNPKAKEGESWFEPDDSRRTLPHLIEGSLQIKLPNN